jgi:hypothetical protein
VTLSQDRRAQLDGIVRQMVTNQEPEDRIQMVVDDFKDKYGATVNRFGDSPDEQSEADLDQRISKLKADLEPLLPAERWVAKTEKREAEQRERSERKALERFQKHCEELREIKIVDLTTNDANELRQCGER